MITYVLAYAVLLLQGAVSAGQPRTRLLLYRLNLVLIFLFVALRWDVGCDWENYFEHFEVTRNTPFDFFISQREPGYWLMVYYAHYFDLDYIHINVVSALLFFIGLHIFAKTQPDPLGFLIMTFPVLIINLPMSALRQAIAVGFLCIAYNYFVRRRPIAYLACIAGGSLFHSSILLFGALAPMVRNGFNTRSVVQSVLLSLPGQYFLFLDDVELYAERYIDTGIDAAGGLFRGGMLGLVGVLFFIYLKAPWKRTFPRDYNLMLIGSLVMIAVFGATFVSTVIGDRLGYYVQPLQIAILARLPYFPMGRDSNLVNALPYVGLGAVLVTWANLSSLFDRCYVPYNSILFSP